MSEIKTDKLTGYSAAGTVTVTAEGGSTTMALMHGMSKAWIFYEADNSNLIRDSLNISSIRAQATGQQGITMTNAMNNDDWTAQVTGTGGSTSSGYGSLESGSWGGSGDLPYRSTTQCNMRFTNYDGNYIEHNDCNVLCHGDLA